MTMEGDRAVKVELAGSQGYSAVIHWQGTLADFFSENEFSEPEKAAIRSAMAQDDEDYMVSGGASPEIWLRRIMSDGPNEIPGYSHACERQIANV